MIDYSLKKNGSGYADPTAYEAIKAVEKEKSEDKMMEFYKGDIVEIELKNGSLREAIVLQVHEKYSNILAITDDARMPYKVTCRGEKYVDPGMVQYVFNDRVVNFVRSMTDSEYEAIMDAVIDALGHVPKQLSGESTATEQKQENEQEPKQQPQPSVRFVRDGDVMVTETEYLKKELVQARIERNVYKELYEKLIGSMMAK